MPLGPHTGLGYFASIVCWECAIEGHLLFHRLYTCGPGALPHSFRFPAGPNQPVPRQYIVLCLLLRLAYCFQLFSLVLLFYSISLIVWVFVVSHRNSSWKEVGYDQFHQISYNRHKVCSYTTRFFSNGRESWGIHSEMLMSVTSCNHAPLVGHHLKVRNPLCPASLLFPLVPNSSALPAT